MRAVVRDFLIGYALAALLILVFALAVAWLLGVETPLGVGLVPFIVGVQVAAQRCARRTGAQPSKSFAWRAALAMTAATAAISGAAFAGFLVLLGGEALFPEVEPTAFAAAFALVAGLLLLLHLLIGRAFFAYMAKTALRAQAQEK